jgi:dystroglycan 1
MMVRPGDDARVRCASSSNVRVNSIEWSKDGDRLPEGAYQQEGELVIPRCRKEYEGRYICTIYFVNGEQKVAHMTLQIEDHTSNVQPPQMALPTVTIDPTIQRINLGGTATFRCDARGNPTPRIRWTKSGDQLAPNHQIQGNVLRIVQATQRDRGVYVCVAESTAGTVQAAAIVEIEDSQEGPRIELDMGNVVDINIGDSFVSYECRATGSPPPSVTWTRVNSEPMTRNTQTAGGVLRFNVITGEEQGTYVCTAVSSAGTATATLTIRVKGGSPRVVIKPAGPQRLSQGQRLIAECRVEGIDDAQLYWQSPSHQQVAGPIAGPQYGSALLDITSVAGHHSGTYTCVARGRTDQAQGTLDVVVVDYNAGDDSQWTTRDPSRTDPHETVEHIAVNVVPQEIQVSRGEAAEFRCTAIGYPAPVMEWSREGDRLPYNHVVRDGLLRIERVEEQDSGTYRCTARNNAGERVANVRLSVTATPTIMLLPAAQTLRPGDFFRVQCTAEGSEPITYEWNKVNGQLPASATVRNGLLEVVSVSAADAGRYQCVAVNNAGRSQSISELSVLAPPSAIISPRTVVKGTGETAEFSCEVTGSPLPRVQWQKENGNLPERHVIEGNRLIIYNVQYQDTGRYICLVANEVGNTRDYATLTLSASSNGNEPSVRERKETVYVGDQVEIDCTAAGDPKPVVKWIKVDGDMSPGVQLRGTRLEIRRITEEDQGTYRCVATSVIGTVFDQVTITVEAPAVVPLSRQSRMVSVGSAVTLACQARGNPAPTVTWSRRDGELPRNHQSRDGLLIIPAIREEDFGEYICSASNRFGSAEGIIVLQSGELVPYFAQNPKSFMTYKGIKEPYQSFDLEVSFKPQTSDGLILYTGKSNDGTGDFVSFGLRNRRAEFRLNVGSGPGIIISDPLQLDQWHTVRIKREGKHATLYMLDKEYTGEAPGDFIGLDVTEMMPLFIGGAPDFNKISKLADFTEGFIGCISRVLVSGTVLNLGGEFLDGEGITDCPVCQYRPCQRGGICRPAATKTGYRCECVKGYSGLQCEQIGERCSPGICGDVGRCYDLANGQGYKCSCPVGQFGLNCEQGSRLHTPMFNYTSYITYQTIPDALMELQLSLVFKAKSVEDALLLYDASSSDGNSDYISLAIKDGYVVFQFDTGSEPAIIKSNELVRVGEWTTVSLERNQRDGSLTIDDRYTVKGSSPGDTVGLNLKTPLYVGGVNHSLVRVAPSVGVTAGFSGCIAQLKIGSTMMNLIQSAIEFRDVTECDNGRPRPCASAPCQNRGTCQQLVGDQFVCHCPLGYAGTLCETTSVVGMSAKFSGTGYIELPQALLPHKSTTSEEIIELTVTTRQSDALLFWNGQMPTTPGRGKDFVSIAIENGRAVFSYQLGSGIANITADGEIINDGLPHHIRATRTGQRGDMEIDGFSLYVGISGGSLTELDTYGNIYIGGLPDAPLMTGGRFKTGLVGCLANVHLMSVGPLDLSLEAVKGVDVEPCES